MAAERDLQEVVSSVLRERFPNIQVVSVNIEHDTDEDGESILMVNIIFNSETPLSARDTSSLARLLLPKLEEIQEVAFPVVSFIAEREVRNAGPNTRGTA